MDQINCNITTMQLHLMRAALNCQSGNMMRQGATKEAAMLRGLADEIKSLLRRSNDGMVNPHWINTFDTGRPVE